MSHKLNSKREIAVYRRLVVSDSQSRLIVDPRQAVLPGELEPLAASTMASNDAAPHKDEHHDEGNTDKVDYAGYSGLKEFMSETTMHGVQYIFRGASLLRFIWLLGVLGALAGFIYFFATAVTDYLHYETNTKIDIVGRSQLPLPAVTICNSNIAQSSSLSDPVKYPQYMENIAFTCDLFDTVGTSDCPLSQNETAKIVAADYRTAKDILKNIGQPKTSMIIDLVVNELNTALGKSGGTLYRNSSEFDTITTSGGVCHTFNMYGSHPNITRIGVLNGVRFLINVDQTEYAGVTLLSAGVEVYLHTPGESIIRGRNAIYIGPGERANIVLKPVYRQVLNKPYRRVGCEMKNINRNKSLPYSRTQCLVECQEQLVAEVCNCLSVSVAEGVSLTTANGTVISHYCRATEYLQCAILVAAAVQVTNESALCQASCLQPCKPAADQFHYDYSLSSDVFPNVVVADTIFSGLVRAGIYNNSAINAPTNLLYLRENLAQINIFYDDLVFQSVIEQPAQTLAGLFGSIGGNLGLYIGASILTLLEFTQYSARFLLARLRKYRGRKDEEGL